MTYSIEPLLQWAGTTNPRILHERSRGRISMGQWYWYVENETLDTQTADKLAISLGIHPCLIWTSWFADAQQELPTSYKKLPALSRGKWPTAGVMNLVNVAPLRTETKHVWKTRGYVTTRSAKTLAQAVEKNPEELWVEWNVTCPEEGCQRAATHKGLCSKHYLRMTKREQVTV